MSSHQTHYRWIKDSEIPEGGLAELSATQVGESGGRKVIHVNQPSDEYDGPGEYIDDTLADMQSNHSSTYKNVAEGIWEETDEDGNTIRVRGKHSNAPDLSNLGPDFGTPTIPDSAPIGTRDLVPHKFAGVDHY